MATPTQPAATNKKFSAMSFVEKLVFLGKFVVFLATFGFAFGHVLDE